MVKAQVKGKKIDSKKSKRLPLTNWKTIKGGPKTRLLSEQVDSVLYGEES